MAVDLAVVIVNWNTREITLDALRTLYDDIQTHGPKNTEVYVVDNASTDGSVETIRADFPQTHLIASERNLGFAGGNNLALREIGFPDGQNLPRAIYLLNPDTLTQPGATIALFNALFSLPETGVVGARLTFGDGSFQHSAFEFPGLMQLWIDLLPSPARFYDSKLNGRYSKSLYAGKEPFPVDHTLGATMMLKREVIQQTGMFDEQFLMYCEEVDWMWRIQNAEWKIYCVPSAHVIHLGGQSTGQVRPQSIINLWWSRLQLYQKYYPRWKRVLAKQIVRVGMRRSIKSTENDISLNEDDRRALVNAYQTVINLTKS